MLGRNPRILAPKSQNTSSNERSKQDNKVTVPSSSATMSSPHSDGTQVVAMDLGVSRHPLQQKLVSLYGVALDLQLQVTSFHRDLSKALVNIIHNKAAAQKRKRGIEICLQQLNTDQFHLDETLSRSCFVTIKHSIGNAISTHWLFDFNLRVCLNSFRRQEASRTSFARN